MRVEFAAPARLDLFEIGLFIARDNQERALSFSAELEDACLRLSHFPERFPVFASGLPGSVRRRVFRDYLIVYRVEDEKITVLRIVHGSVDLSKLIEKLDAGAQ